ncbi:unnamed protein product [Brassica napus]|uniref:(rape) hypothetical protein n=1 Tax=Brassica napus TaxID=3708 RepID=A0A816RDD8_BRANA|nr:unnamed protein product [Brassica napus]
MKRRLVMHLKKRVCSLFLIVLKKKKRSKLWIDFVCIYVARKLRRTSASRFGTGIGIGTLWKLTESCFQNSSKIFSLKTRWKLMILFWNHASVL